MFGIKLGLSGTLPDFVHEDLIKDYKFKFRSEVPSTFDKQAVKRLPTKFVKHTGESARMELHKTLVDIKTKQFCGDRTKGAAIVLLKDKDTLESCDQYVSGTSPAHLDTLSSSGDYESTISRSSMDQQFTLAEKNWARGTDFPSRSTDEGVLVVDTVPWPTKADAIQAEGRTGRQDSRGTYQRIWLIEDLKENFPGHTFDDDEITNLVHLSDEARNKHKAKDTAGFKQIEDQFDAFIDALRDAEERTIVDAIGENLKKKKPTHDKTMLLVHDLQAGNIESLKAFQ